ncbi:MAG TPA: protein translocase SEC61 complex subunit gamma [Archaeoglobus profundus]|nr:protein translocase SEC61 complex subunit gamma [Archaeoglobus profundus]
MQIKQNFKLEFIKAKVNEYLNVLKMARKPNREEFITTTKIAIIVMFLIGFVGFVIYLLMDVLPRLIIT